MKTTASTLKEEPHRRPAATLKPTNTRQGERVISITESAPILIASPHPDDETLGCGGLIARCALLDCPLTVLAMTRGEASHPGDVEWQQKLGAIRQQEQSDALRTLGLTTADLVCAGLPDGGLEGLGDVCRGRTMEEVLALIHSRGIRTVFSPAIDDRHGDHRWTARLMASAALASGIDRFFSYQIWPPEARDPRVAGAETPYVHEVGDLIHLKRQAIQQYRSQLEVIDPAHSEGFRIPADLLEDKLADVESYALVRDPTTWVQ